MVLSPAGLSRRCHAALLIGAAACPDRADDLSVHDNRNAAFGCHRSFRKGRECPITRGVLIREDFARTPEQHGGACLGLGNLDRSQMRAVHLLEVDELARRSHDGERHAPVVLLGLGNRGGGDGLCLLIGDRRPVVGRRPGRRRRRRLLGEASGGKRQHRAEAKRGQDIKSHGPVSSWTSRRHDVVENWSSPCADKGRVQATFRRALDQHRRVAIARARSAVAEARGEAARPANMAGPMRTVTMQATRPTWAVLVVLLLATPTAAFAQANCRNTAPFEPWLADFKKEAAAKGISQSTIAAASPYLVLDQRI